MCLSDSSDWSGDFSHRCLLLAEKLTHCEVGILGCLCGGKRSLCNINNGARNSIWPQGTFVSQVIRKVWNNHVYAEDPK